MRIPALLVAALLVAVTIAGCLGNEPDVPAEPAASTEPDPGAEPGPGPASPPVGASAPMAAPASVALRFPLGAVIDQVYWHNGTFSAEETGVGGGFVTGDFVHTLDLTALVPANVPTRLNITATIDGQQVPIVGPTARADPISNGTVWYDAYWRNGGDGVFTFGGIVKRAPGGTIGVAVEAYTSGPDEPPDVAYTIRTHVSARPDGIPLGVPTAITLNRSDTLTFHTAPGNQAELLLYGPDDRLLDRLFFVGHTTWTTPRNTTGDLVIIPILGTTDLRVAGPQPAGLRALDLQREQGEPRGLTLMDTTSWEFTADERPLRILVTVLGTGGQPWTCAGTLDLALTGPDATILQRRADCPSPTNLPFLYAERHTWSTHAGDPQVVQGTYTVTVDNTLWSGHQAYHAIETYRR